MGDSLTWRRFCRIPLDRPVPHPTTLIKIVRRCGPEAIDALGNALLRKLVATRRLRARKVRLDTTAMEADIDYPTDAGLLRKAVGRTTRLVKRIKAKGGASRTPFRDRRRSASRRMLAIVRMFRRRREERLAEIDRLTADAARIARSAVNQAQAVARNLRPALRHRPGDGTLRLLLADLDETLSLTDRLLEQTALRVKGQRTSPGRLISLADPDARTIRRGKARHPNEFGYKVLVAECSEGFIVHHRTERGNPRPPPHPASRRGGGGPDRQGPGHGGCRPWVRTGTGGASSAGSGGQAG